MPGQMTRRGFVKASAAAMGTAAVGGVFSLAASAAGRPEEYIIVEGHRDIWELNDRLKLKDRKQTAAPMRDFMVPRMIEAGMSVCIMPACGDSVEERHGRQAILEGSLLTLDMILTEIEKCGDKASIIKTRADIPSKPNRGRVQFFLDIEGGASIEIEPEPDFPADRWMYKLRHFFRLGCRGLQPAGGKARTGIPRRAGPAPRTGPCPPGRAGIGPRVRGWHSASGTAASTHR